MIMFTLNFLQTQGGMEGSREGLRSFSFCRKHAIGHTKEEQEQEELGGSGRILYIHISEVSLPFSSVWIWGWEESEVALRLI